MIAKISTILDTTPDKLWSRIKHPDSLIYVCKPILYFAPKNNTKLDSYWEVDKAYNLNLFLFKYIPFGSHKLTIKSINTSSNEIVSQESGLLAKTWNHTISFKSINAKQIRYTDTLEIKSGLITIFVWIFAQIFYRHRQKKWRKLLLKTGHDKI
jgi:hypothetical protein